MLSPLKNLVAVLPDAIAKIFAESLINKKNE